MLSMLQYFFDIFILYLYEDITALRDGTAPGLKEARDAPRCTLKGHRFPAAQRQ